MLSYAKWILSGLVVAIAGLWLFYYLPSHEIVRIVGTDTKRVDQRSDDPAVRDWRDVRYINTVTESGSERVFRNEDTGWSFPFYFKFDSGSLQARAQSLTSGRDTPTWVSVTSYGWRFPMFSQFPNAVRLTEVDSPDATIIPWFNILFLTGLAILLFWFWRLFRRFKRRRLDPLAEDLDDRYESFVDELDRHTNSKRPSGLWARFLGLFR